MKSEEFITTVLKAIEGATRADILGCICAALVKAGTLEARKVLETVRDRLELWNRVAVEWHLEGLTAEGVLEELARAGALKKPLPSDVVAQIVESWTKSTHAGGLLIDAFHHAGTLVAIDMETGVPPVGHDELVNGFARATQGAFLPEAVTQEVVGADEHPSHGPGPENYYNVQFIYRGKLYRFKAENRGDGYDAKLILRVGVPDIQRYRDELTSESGRRRARSARLRRGRPGAGRAMDGRAPGRCPERRLGPHGLARARPARRGSRAPARIRCGGGGGRAFCWAEPLGPRPLSRRARAVRFAPP